MTRYPGWGGIENVTSLIVSELSKTENDPLAELK